jgi:hypothetical protein
MDHEGHEEHEEVSADVNDIEVEVQRGLNGQGLGKV